VAINAYDASLHDIGLGPSGDQSGFIIVGPYSKSVQKQTLLNGREYGGDTDLIKPSPEYSRWTQDDFSGGMFSERFERDAAMFSVSVGFMPDQLSRSVVSCPPMVAAALYDITTESNPDSRTDSDMRTPRSIFCGETEETVYVVFPHGILGWNQTDGQFTWANESIAAGQYYVSGGYDKNEQRIYVLVDDSGDEDDNTTPFFVRYKQNLTLASHHPRIYPVDESAAIETQLKGSRARGFALGNQQILCGFGLKLWALDPPDPITDDAETPTWTKIGRLPGKWIDSVSYNVMTYILCGSKEQETYLVAYDGFDIMPICEFPYNFRGKCIFNYAGRMYVGGMGTDINGDSWYAELHEITGSSARLVRTWKPMTFQTVRRYPHAIRDLIAAEGLMWWSQQGVMMMTYDVTTDAFFGSGEIQGGGAQTAGYAELQTHLVGAFNDLLFRASASGASGDTITMEYDCVLDPLELGGYADNQVLDSDTIGTNIVVTLATDADGYIVSLASEVKTAIEADGAAMALIDPPEYPSWNDGTGLVTVMAERNFVGGTAASGATDVQMWKLTHGRGSLVGWGDSATDSARGFYRIASTDDTVADYTCYLETSDFSVEPALSKRWKQIVIQSRWEALDQLEYSTNGGDTYTTVATTNTNDGDMHYATADLSALALSKHIRFKFSFDRGVDIETNVELMAYTVAFEFVDATTQKHHWNFTINASALIEARDGTTEEQAVDTFRSTLWSWADTKLSLVLTDFDGTNKTVIIKDIVENMPMVGPDIDSTNQPEAYFNLLLTES
jgi:hypothetical protein